MLRHGYYQSHADFVVKLLGTCESEIFIRIESRIRIRIESRIESMCSHLRVILQTKRDVRILLVPQTISHDQSHSAI